MKSSDKKERKELADAQRRSFLKKAGAIAVAVPVIESMSREGLLVRSAHAQSGPISIENNFGGPILEFP